VSVSFAKEDARPPFSLDDVASARFNQVRAQRAPGAAFFTLQNVRDFSVRNSPGLADASRERVEKDVIR